MKIRRHSEDYNFFGDTVTGYTLRWGRTLDDNPKMAPWPELADISISNYCTKGCDFCYRNSSVDGDFMSIEDYRLILENFKNDRWGSVFQVALGGGEPLEHPDFIEILKITAEYKIVPNFTTNGIHLTPTLCQAMKPYVGAVAVSADSIKDINRNIDYLLQEGIKVNLHYILSEESIEEAIQILEGKFNQYLEGINALIFLTYKPQGRGARDKCVKKDERLLHFMDLVKEDQCLARIGFDACFVPMLLRYTDTDTNYIDSCECGFFSVYIDEMLNVKPCSFTNEGSHVYNLKEFTFDDIWNNKFTSYRDYIAGQACPAECEKKCECRGSCIYYEDLQLCY